jgi:hypothetical protein
MYAMTGMPKMMRGGRHAQDDARGNRIAHDDAHSDRLLEGEARCGGHAHEETRAERHAQNDVRFREVRFRAKKEPSLPTSRFFITLY